MVSVSMVRTPRRSLEEHRQELIDASWTQVAMPWGYSDTIEPLSLTTWCKYNKLEFRTMGRFYFFKKESDAAFFILRWL